MTNQSAIIPDWNAGLYDDKHAFVFKYGEDLLQWLNPQPGEQILDVGCGTGYLAHLMAEAGAEVWGIDSAASMIEKAEKEYPGIRFSVADITAFSSDVAFDAVFSNAVLHWIQDKEAAVRQIYRVLKPGGRLVLEMGGKGNVKSIVNALRLSLAAYGYQENASAAVWYFPSLGEYTTLLESVGFRIRNAAHFDRETELKDADEGIADWICMFGQQFFDGIPPEQVQVICREVQETLRSTRFRNGKWYADYKRLRVIAVKENQSWN